MKPVQFRTLVEYAELLAEQLHQSFCTEQAVQGTSGTGTGPHPRQLHAQVQRTRLLRQAFLEQSGLDTVSELREVGALIALALLPTVPYWGQVLEGYLAQPSRERSLRILGHIRGLRVLLDSGEVPLEVILRTDEIWSGVFELSDGMFRLGFYGMGVALLTTALEEHLRALAMRLWDGAATPPASAEELLEVFTACGMLTSEERELLEELFAMRNAAWHVGAESFDDADTEEHLAILARATRRARQMADDIRSLRNTLQDDAMRTRGLGYATWLM